MTTLTGSLVLALAVAHGRLTPDEAWRSAHVDEDFQAERWGADGRGHGAAGGALARIRGGGDRGRAHACGLIGLSLNERSSAATGTPRSPDDTCNVMAPGLCSGASCPASVYGSGLWYASGRLGGVMIRRHLLEDVRDRAKLRSAEFARVRAVRAKAARFRFGSVGRRLHQRPAARYRTMQPKRSPRATAASFKMVEPRLWQCGRRFWDGGNRDECGRCHDERRHNRQRRRDWHLRRHQLRRHCKRSGERRQYRAERHERRDDYRQRHRGGKHRRRRDGHDR